MRLDEADNRNRRENLSESFDAAQGERREVKMIEKFPFAELAEAWGLEAVGTLSPTC
jgi:hypothetical protein